MEYRVEELAARAGVAVDTVRYYQSRGLLEAPERRGRVAVYRDGHLAQLKRVRELAGQGFKLAQIERLLERADADGPLLDALVAEHVGGRTFSRAELAAEAGVPEALLAGAESAGLIQALEVGDEQRFSEADLQMARAGLSLMNGGLPIPALLELAQEHARGIESVTERAIDLFDDHVRKAGVRKAGVRGAGRASVGEAEAVSDLFRTLLPEVTRLVALHFQRTLVRRALERLADSGGDESLRDALTASGGSHLAIDVEWR